MAQDATATPSGSAPRPHCLVVDYGGVLTTPLSDTMGAWLEQEGIPVERFRAVMKEWMSRGASANPAHELETGTLAPADFERAFAAKLAGPDGAGPDPEGLLERMFAGFRSDPGMSGVLARAKELGLRTALLSNSWGFDYDRVGWDALFDVVVISGEVGMRKPDAEIYLLTAERLGVDPSACVFVDDLRINVTAAAEVGMAGVVHHDVATTTEELTALLGVDLRVPGDAVPGSGS